MATVDRMTTRQAFFAITEIASIVDDAPSAASESCTLTMKDGRQYKVPEAVTWVYENLDQRMCAQRPQLSRIRINKQPEPLYGERKICGSTAHLAKGGLRRSPPVGYPGYHDAVH